MKGTILLVGLGPGDPTGLTGLAREALERADVLGGYDGYLDLVRPLFPDKETFSTPMRGELERCRTALALAAEGRTVALVCSGDAGVYGMAAPLLELAGETPEADIQVIPGVTAALSGAALLGAPLGHDFCVVSLSDLLTPWEVIVRRLRSAVLGDFVLCLYNPASHKRRDHLRRACNILLEAGRAPETPCGWARNIGREGQDQGVLSLEELRSFPADMFTTVFVGSSATRRLGERLLTPRGYRT